MLELLPLFLKESITIVKLVQRIKILHLLGVLIYRLPIQAILV